MNRYLPHVIFAVAEWNDKQTAGRALTPTEASDAIKAMFDSKAARAGCGAAKVSTILQENHGWIKSGRMIMKSDDLV